MSLSKMEPKALKAAASGGTPNLPRLKTRQLTKAVTEVKSVKSRDVEAVFEILARPPSKHKNKLCLVTAYVATDADGKPTHLLQAIEVPLPDCLEALPEASRDREAVVKHNMRACNEKGCSETITQFIIDAQSPRSMSFAPNSFSHGFVFLQRDENNVQVPVIVMPHVGMSLHPCLSRTSRLHRDKIGSRDGGCKPTAGCGNPFECAFTMAKQHQEWGPSHCRSSGKNARSAALDRELDDLNRENRFNRSSRPHTPKPQLASTDTPNVPRADDDHLGAIDDVESISNAAAAPADGVKNTTENLIDFDSPKPKGLSEPFDLVELAAKVAVITADSDWTADEVYNSALEVIGQDADEVDSATASRLTALIHEAVVVGIPRDPKNAAQEKPTESDNEETGRVAALDAEADDLNTDPAVADPDAQGGSRREAQHRSLRSHARLRQPVVTGEKTQKKILRKPQPAPRSPPRPAPRLDPRKLLTEVRLHTSQIGTGSVSGAAAGACLARAVEYFAAAMHTLDRGMSLREDITSAAAGIKAGLNSVLINASVTTQGVAVEAAAGKATAIDRGAWREMRDNIKQCSFAARELSAAQKKLYVNFARHVIDGGLIASDLWVDVIGEGLK